MPEPDPAPLHARHTTVLLAFVFAATWFTNTAMAAHLPRLLLEGGATLAMAVAVGALVGPARGRVGCWSSVFPARAPSAVRAAGGLDASDGGRAARYSRSTGGSSLCHVQRRRQWHPYHCQADAAPGVVRSSGILAPARLSDRARTDCASGIALGVWDLPGPTGSRCIVGFSGTGRSCVPGVASRGCACRCYPRSLPLAGWRDHFVCALARLAGSSAGPRRLISPFSTIRSNTSFCHLRCSAISSLQAPSIALNPVSIDDSG